MIHKRGILLFGRPGSGKSVIIQRLIKHIIEVKDGIVINISSSNCVENYFTFAPEILRVIEPDRPLLVILEELDQLIYRSHIDIPAMLLNLLDGIKQIGNVIYMATTNHPERLDAHFTNRPGRFDVKKRLGLLTEEGREYFLRHKLTVDEIAKIDFKKWVTDSEGLSIAHLKELIVSVLIIGKDYEKTIESLKRMKDFKSSREDNVSEVGF
jgi:ATP-dependent 26S proteasome regulatory subunit